MNPPTLPAGLRPLLAAAALASAAPLAAALPPTPPGHVVVVVEENHGYSDIIGSSAAPYLNALARSGALMTRSYATTHPSEPNYLELFSGSTQGVTDDSCPHTFAAPNLGGQLLAAGKTFVGFSEDLPSVGYTGCSSGKYAQKHNPWVMFADIPAAANQPFSTFPQGHFQDLPTVSFVIPNLDNDMHDGTIQAADSWLRTNLDAYVQWAKANNSLLVVTFDEDDSGGDNQIATLFCGPMVKAGQYAETINHDNVLRTLEDLYGLGHAGRAANAVPVTDIWTIPGPPPATFTVTASAGPGGTISPSGVVTVAQGGSVTFTVTPTGGYAIQSVTVDGADQGPVRTYTFTQVTANHVIAAIFAPVPATGRVISIDFVGRGTAMAATEVAGVVPRANWNAALGAARSTYQALADETGAATGATLRWFSTNVWSLPGTAAAGDARMMQGYLDTVGATTIIRLAGLPPAANGYDVYVYADGDNQGASRSGVYQVSGTGLATTSLRLTDPGGANFAGTYRQAAGGAGNYVRFHGVKATAFNLTAIPSTASDGVPRAPVNGLQLVPATNP
jgi:hypothetical protein